MGNKHIDLERFHMIVKRFRLNGIRFQWNGIKIMWRIWMWGKRSETANKPDKIMVEQRIIRISTQSFTNAVDAHFFHSSRLSRYTMPVFSACSFFVHFRFKPLSDDIRVGKMICTFRRSRSYNTAYWTRQFRFFFSESIAWRLEKCYLYAQATNTVDDTHICETDRKTHCSTL